jgi:glycosyltransferase involved in cell wall biosynthesis
MNSNDVTVLLPALNESGAIGKTIDEIRKHGYLKIIVVDNSSKDDTALVAIEHGARLLNCETRGKGNAVKFGIAQIKTPYIVMIDADYTYPAKYINDIVELLEDYDVVMAERHIRLDNSMPLANLLGNRALSLCASILYWFWTSDLCTGMWGFRSGVLDKFDIVSPHFNLEADLFTNARKNKCRIARIPIAYRSRSGDSHSHLHIWHGLKIGLFLIKRRLGLC